MKSSKQEIVLQHLQKHGSLGWIEANQKYGINRLANYILALKKRGYNITHQMVETELFGERVKEAVYFLVVEDHEKMESV